MHTFYFFLYKAMELHRANLSAQGHTKAAFQKESFRQ